MVSTVRVFRGEVPDTVELWMGFHNESRPVDFIEPSCDSSAVFALGEHVQMMLSDIEERPISVCDYTRTMDSPDAALDDPCSLEHITRDREERRRFEQSLQRPPPSGGCASCNASDDGRGAPFALLLLVGGAGRRLH